MAENDYTLGIRLNLKLFLQQIAQVFLVGLTIGAERTVLPVLAEGEFGVPPGSMVLLVSFVVSFGLVKAAMNVLSGQLSERFGRRPLLIAGWVAALPLPLILLLAPSWGWIVAGNVLLGVNQGFAWSMTVTAKHDIVPTSERGLATGVNEFAGYGGVALAGLATGYLATLFEPRVAIAAFSGAVILVALGAAVIAFGETVSFARAAAVQSKADTAPKSVYEVFQIVTWRDGTLSALSQAGSVEKFVDALIWAILPLYLAGQGASLVEIGWVAGVYGLVWGPSQLWTGPLSDRIGRRPPAIAGMTICGLGVLAFPLVSGATGWAAVAAVTGFGMALLYPTLIAAVGDRVSPSWRGAGLGAYRFWRDLGYAFGALAMGLVADRTGSVEAAFWFVGFAMLVSASWLALAMEETNPVGE